MIRSTGAGQGGEQHEMSEFEQGIKDIHARTCHGQSVPKWD